MSKFDRLPKYIKIIAVGIFAFGVVLSFTNTSQAPVVSPFTNTIVSRKPATSLFFAGDIMLARNVAGKIYLANDINLPYQNVKDEIIKADIAFANLESPFNDQGIHFKEGSINFNADPNFLAGLGNSGFDILSTANNHTLDQGLDGLTYTYNNLKRNNIIPIGTTVDCHNGVTITKNNISFGFLAYSYTAYNDNGKILDKRVCDANDLSKVSKDIQTLRPKVDQLYVSVHMGVEYTRNPNLDGIKFAHNAIDSGADFVFGHHPHWVQTIEKYQDKWIFYSLGNFIFDQMFSQDTREGLTVMISYQDKKLSKIELKPIIIENYCCPRWADENETKSILNKINLTSPIL